jgi:hypothetical protein
MKRAFPLFGLIGLVGCFLPLVPGFSLFDARHFDASTVWLLIAAFAVPAAIGFSNKVTTGAALVSAACFGYILYVFGFDTFDLVWHGSIGAKAMGVAVIGGLVSSLASLGDSER